MTEQDVINEEMYEEEDDDLPFQYRRLTAHLQTGSAAFNRRLAAYLTNHVAIRSALDQAITDSYAQQYPHAPRFAHNAALTFPSPMLPQQMAPPTPTTPVAPAAVMTPGTPTPSSASAANYRQSPYPVPGTPAFRQRPHMRTGSVSATQDATANPSIEGQSRPAAPKSTPSTTDVPRAEQPSAQVSASQKPQPLSEAPRESTQAEQTWSEAPLPHPSQQRHMQSTVDPIFASQQFMQPAIDWSLFCNDRPPPLSMALPTESQLLLGPALNPTDPLTSMFMAGSNAFPRPWEDVATSPLAKAAQKLHPSYDGVHATLAPSALDLSQTSAPGPEPAFPRLFELNADGQAPIKTAPAAVPALAPEHLARDHAPGDECSIGGEDWSAFINDLLWE